MVTTGAFILKYLGFEKDNRTCRWTRPRASAAGAFSFAGVDSRNGGPK